MDILVLLPFDDEQRAVFESGAPAGARITYMPKAEVTDEQIAQAEVIVGNLPPARLAHAEHLRLLQLNSAGYDQYLAPGALPAGAALACAVGAYGQAVSEHIFTMVLMLMKHLEGYRDDFREHAWTDRGTVSTIAGANVLVLGAGDIGTHFAGLAFALGAHVTGVRRHVGEVPACFESMRTMDELPALLPSADIIVSFLPSSPETRGLVDAEFLASCKRGVYLANGGRGDLIVQPDLIAALESGQVAGAALDVTTPEPLSADDPLWDAPNIFITPHVAGQFHLPVVLTNIAHIAAENLQHLAAGEPLRNQVKL